MAGKVKVRELLTKWSFKSDSRPIAVLDKGVRGLRKTVKFATKGLALFGAGAVAAGAGILGLVKSVADSSDQIAKASKRVGVSTQTLQKLKHAAELSGTSLSELVTGMRRLAAAAYDADHGSKAAQDAFAELGVVVRDGSGNLKTNEDLLRETLVAMTQMEDKTKRAAVAQKLFGRSGTSLLPMLSGGAMGIAEMMKEAEDLGLVLSDDAMKGAEDFNDAMLRLKGVVGGFAARFASGLMPIITKWIKSLQQWVTENKHLIDQELPKLAQDLADGLKELFKNIKPGDIKEMMSELTGFFKGLGQAGFYIGKVFKWIGKAFYYVGHFIGWLAAQVYLAVEGVIGFFVRLYNKIAETFRMAYDQIAGFFSGIYNWVAALPGRFKAALASVWGSIVSTFQASDAAVSGFFSGIWAWLAALPKRVWDSLVGGFWSALEGVKQAFVDAYNWLRNKLGKLMDWITGGATSKIEVKVDQARQAAKAAGAPAPAMAPAAAAAGASGEAVTYAPTINVTVPPGTPASVAERAADGAAGATANTFRRTITDVKR